MPYFDDANLFSFPNATNVTAILTANGVRCNLSLLCSFSNGNLSVQQGRLLPPPFHSECHLKRLFVLF